MYLAQQASGNFKRLCLRIWRCSYSKHARVIIGVCVYVLESEDKLTFPKSHIALEHLSKKRKGQQLDCSLGNFFTAYRAGRAGVYCRLNSCGSINCKAPAKPIELGVVTALFFSVVKNKTRKPRTSGTLCRWIFKVKNIQKIKKLQQFLFHWSLSLMVILQPYPNCGFPQAKRVPKLRQAGLQKLQYIWKRMFLGPFHEMKSTFKISKTFGCYLLNTLSCCREVCTAFP